jgi:hypothetical protein
MKGFDKRTVIVMDNSNYIAEYAEKVPFKAIVTQVYENTMWVKSVVTEKQYELYYSQILESMDIEEIEFILKMDDYGMHDYKLLHRK